MNKDLEASRPSRLTEKELSVLELISQGRTSQQIAEELLMPTSQVERHRLCILEKFSVKDEQGAIEKAVEFGHVVNQ